MVRLRVKEYRTQLIENAVKSLYPPLANYSLTPVDGPFYSVHILDCPLTALATDPLNSQSIATELSAKIQSPVQSLPFSPCMTHSNLALIVLKILSLQIPNTFVFSISSRKTQHRYIVTNYQ